MASEDLRAPTSERRRLVSEGILSFHRLLRGHYVGRSVGELLAVWRRLPLFLGGGSILLLRVTIIDLCLSLHLVELDQA